jgi:hypothetical protein
MCPRLAAASDQVYQLPAHRQWFSPGTLASFTTKTGRLKHLASEKQFYCVIAKGQDRFL